MRGLKRTLRKSIYDVVICFGLLFPELFPDLSFSGGVRTTFVVVMGIATVLGCLSAFLLAHSKAKEILKEKDLRHVDLWYRIYEPTSDLALTICMIISGHPVLSGVYLFVGVFQRSFIYRVVEEHKELKND